MKSDFEIIDYTRLSSTTATAVLQMDQSEKEELQKAGHAEIVLYKKYLNHYLSDYHPGIKVIDLLNEPDYSKDIKDPNRVNCTLNFKVAKA